MDGFYDNIIDITHNYYKYLINMENVNGIGLGFKEINGINTFEPCIHVLVQEKINSKYLTSNNIVPKTYMGIKTDVIKVKKSKIRGNEFIPKKLRPLQGGIGISPNGKIKGIDTPSGTLGCIVKKTYSDENEFFILSNAHVLAGQNEFDIGTPIIQPSKISGGSFQSDIVATLTTYERIKFIQGKDEPINFIDAGIAKLVSNNLASSILYDLGNFKGVAKPTLNLPIQKVGFVTGLSFGKIKSMSVSTPVEYDDGLDAFFQDLILSDDLENEAGDSGAVVVTDSNEVVGLLTSGIDNYAFFSGIQLVLDTFKVQIYIK